METIYCRSSRSMRGQNCLVQDLFRYDLLRCPATVCLCVPHGGWGKCTRTTRIRAPQHHRRGTVPEICRELSVIAIGKDIDTYVELRPNVKYIGNMHGNEAIGREMLLHLVEQFVVAYSTNATIKKFLDTTVVHIMPSMNPDGYEKTIQREIHGIAGRYNEQGIDLNRNFPDELHDLRLKHIANETQALMDWLPKHNFVLSASIHGGAIVANYPYDDYVNTSQRMSLQVPSTCPDDDTFQFLALTYSRSHASMATTNQCYNTFKDGITNGADWYYITGGMQDYNYIKHGIYELSLELSCNVFPGAADLKNYWIDNKDALVNLLLEAHRGVKGIVKMTNGTAIEGAELVITGRESAPFLSRNYGEYYRLLMPGEYTLQVNYQEFNPESQNFTVMEGEITRLDVILVNANETACATCIVGQSVLPLIAPLLCRIITMF